MIHDGRELVVTEEFLCLNCGHRGHMSEWMEIYVELSLSLGQISHCPNCGCCGNEIAVLDESEVKNKWSLNG